MGHRCWNGKIKSAFLLIFAIVTSAGIVSGLDIPHPSILKNYLNLDAEEITISKDRGLLEATGGVHLEYEGKKIAAGRLSYYYERGMVELDGGVSFVDEDMEFSFSKIAIDLRAKKSVFYDGYIHVRSEHLIVSAERFEELSKDRFKIFKARLTTCDVCEKADWRINIRRGTLTLGGYATGTGISLDIRERPFFWFPFAFFPAKTDRESGLLFPKFQTSRTKGTRVILPFYLVTSEYSDATFSFDYMSKRGVKPEGEFRYRLTEHSRGKLTGSYIDDRNIDDERFRVIYESNVTGQFPFFQTANVDYASDRDYYTDFEEGIHLRSSRQIISEISTGYEKKTVYFELFGTYVEDLLPAGDKSETLQILPSLGGTFRKNRLLSHLFASADLAVKNFYTSAGGSTQKGTLDLVAELPVGIGDIFIFHLYSNLDDSIYYYESQPGDRTTEYIAYWDNRGTIKTSLYKKYTMKNRGLVHRVEPYLTLQKTKRVTGFSPVVFEPSDRAPEKTRIIFGFRNIFTNVYEGGMMSNLGSVVFKYSIDFERKVDRSANLIDPFSEYFRTYQDQIDIAVDGTLSDDLRSDLYFEGDLKPLKHLELNTEGFFDTKNGIVDKVSFGLKYDDKDTTYISMMVRHTRALATDLNLNYNDRIFRWLRVKGGLNYSLKDAVVIENSSFLEYIPRSECWGLTFGLSRKTRPAETSYSLFFSLRGLGAIGK